VPRYSSGTSNRFPSAMYMAQWHCCDRVVVQHASSSIDAVLTLRHFLTNWASLFGWITAMAGCSWFSGSLLRDA
jgi:hypothetical protein